MMSLCEWPSLALRQWPLVLLLKLLACFPSVFLWLFHLHTHSSIWISQGNWIAFVCLSLPSEVKRRGGDNLVVISYSALDYVTSYSMFSSFLDLSYQTQALLLRSRSTRLGPPKHFPQLLLPWPSSFNSVYLLYGKVSVVSPRYTYTHPQPGLHFIQGLLTNPTAHTSNSRFTKLITVQSITTLFTTIFQVHFWFKFHTNLYESTTSMMRSSPSAPLLEHRCDRNSTQRPQHSSHSIYPPHIRYSVCHRPFLRSQHVV